VLRLNPNVAAAHAWIGLAKTTIGRAGETEAHVNEALRISPGEYTTFVWNTISGAAELCLGADDEAVARFRRAIEINRNFPPPHFLLAAALAHLGQRDEARFEAEAGLALDPKVSIRDFRAAAESGNPTYLAQRERIIEGLRMAGISEKWTFGARGPLIYGSAGPCNSLRQPRKERNPNFGGAEAFRRELFKL
jgi:tetratricopeptide (TPR) repeat protein